MRERQNNRRGNITLTLSAIYNVYLYKYINCIGRLLLGFSNVPEKKAILNNLIVRRKRTNKSLIGRFLA